MKRLRKKIHMILLLSMIFLLIIPIPTLAQDNSFDVPAKAAIAVDFDTGKILYEKNSTTPLPIASMSKLISAYLVYEAIDKGQIHWNDTVSFDDELIKLTEDPELSNIPIKKNLTYTVEDNVKAMLISSSNVSTTALARLISGSEQSFVDQMSQKVAFWGINDAKFISASGLDTEDLAAQDRYQGSDGKDSNILSAKDMVIVARNLLKDYPEVLEITKQPSYTLFAGTENEETFWSSNLMLPGLDYYTEGTDGLKTGTTPNAGACFIGSTVLDGHRIITVVMNVDESHSRFEVTKNLLDYVNTNWEYKTLAKAGDHAVQETMAVPNGEKETVDVILDEPISMWVHKENSTIKEVFDANRKELSAPVRKGQIVGTQVITDTTDTLGYLNSSDTHQSSGIVVTKNENKKATIFVRVWRSLKNSIQ